MFLVTFISVTHSLPHLCVTVLGSLTILLSLLCELFKKNRLSFLYPGLRTSLCLKDLKNTHTIFCDIKNVGVKTMMKLRDVMMRRKEEKVHHVHNAVVPYWTARNSFLQ